MKKYVLKNHKIKEEKQLGVIHNLRRQNNCQTRGFGPRNLYEKLFQSNCVKIGNIFLNFPEENMVVSCC